MELQTACRSATEGGSAAGRAAGSARSGEFIGPGGLAELRGEPTRVRPSAAVTDPGIGRRLWEVSERLTDVRFVLPAPV
ncbi:hypothetical protein GCM10009678_61250 [Actinomadura kijaniata]